MSSKVYQAVSFLESAYQYKIDIVPMAGVLCSLLASFVETATDSASCPTCFLCSRFLVV